MDLSDVCAAAGREPGELTRRDLARALLAVPATEALDAVPRLRRDLLAAGNPQTRPFWDETEELIRAIKQRTTTVGAVRRWLEATGTEPTQPVAGGFAWPDEHERGPVAEEYHARLVAHLEDLVAAGRIDPDRLLAGDQEALTNFEQVQVTWLYTPDENGREPIWAVTDEEDDALLAAWDDVDTDARELLAELLNDVGPRPCPEDALHAATATLRLQVREDSWRGELLRSCVGDLGALPRDDRTLWTELASYAVTGGHLDPTEGPLTDDDHVAWMTLDHAAWIAAVATLAQLGPGAAADADALGRYAATFEIADDPDVVWLDDPLEEDGDDLELSWSRIRGRLRHLTGPVLPDVRAEIVLVPAVEDLRERARLRTSARGLRSSTHTSARARSAASSATFSVTTARPSARATSATCWSSAPRRPKSST